jgi:hypothetical protein
VEFESRPLDPIGRIWSILCFIFLAALLWWRELWLGRKLEIGISRNKAVFPVFWRLGVLVLLRGTGRSSMVLCVKLSRWRLGVFYRVGEAFFNKRFCCLLCTWRLLLWFSLLACRGGEEKGKLDDEFCCDGEGRGVSGTVSSWSSSSVAHVWLPTIDAGGQQLQNLAPVVRQVICNLLRRPCVCLAAELILSTAPSGLVPGAGGGGRCASQKIHDAGGPDCVFSYLFRVCNVKCRDLVRLVLFNKVRFVIYSAPFLD